MWYADVTGGRRGRQGLENMVPVDCPFFFLFFSSTVLFLFCNPYNPFFVNVFFPLLFLSPFMF